MTTANNHFSEIAALAESIAEENIIRGKVDLDGITQKKEIKIIRGKYGEYFIGELVYDSGRFYIHLNNDLLVEKEVGRTRFTIAHELGHYFIDNHRNIMEQGISLSHKADYTNSSKNPIELQANHFATNLLLPKQRVLKAVSNFDPGLNSIIRTKKLFDTSISCAALAYVKFDIYPCILIKWNNNFIFSYASYSDSFSRMTGISGKPPIKINKLYLEDVCKQHESEKPKPEFIEKAVFLSTWLAEIAPGSHKDYTGLEQTIKLGNYGGITLLSFF